MSFDPIALLPARAKKYGELFHRKEKLKKDLKKPMDPETRVRITREIVALESQMTDHVRTGDHA